MKRKKITALFAVLAMTASLVAGCGSSGSTEDSAVSVDEGTTAGEEASVNEGSEEEPAPEAESAGDAEAVTIWYYWETEGHQVALDQVIQEYNASQGNY